MASLRPPGWLIYPVAVGLLLAGAARHRGYADAPPTPPALPSGEGAILAQASPLDLVATAKVRPGEQVGTAFSVADKGVWLTAARTLAHCAHPAIVVNGVGVPANASVSPGAEAAVLTTASGAPALPISAASLRSEELGYAAGFPQGRPGEAATRLLGRRTLYLRPRGAHGLTVLAWAEAGRTQGLAGPMTPGLVGAPVLDQDGAVVGIVLSEAPRRGRLYVAAPAAVASALATAKASRPAGAAGFPLTPDNYGLAGDDLRRSLRIAPVACVSARS
ncbi:MAG TPA: trypsin-like peptidase domain-containing protein [Caulobacteraceae bacterium]